MDRSSEVVKVIIKDNNKISDLLEKKPSTKPSSYKDTINDEAIFFCENDHSLAAVETVFITFLDAQLITILLMLQWKILAYFI